jgi:DNA-binding PadR family transcriptional regulator
MFNFEWTKRTHKGLRKWVLFILRDSPRTGVEIMDIMEGNLQGWWRPSPGSIYPLLESLVKEGVISRSADKKYSLTAKGLEELDNPFPWTSREAVPPRSPQEVIELMSSYVSYLEDLAHSDGKTISPSQGQIRDLAARLEKLGSSS